MTSERLPPARVQAAIDACRWMAVLQVRLMEALEADAAAAGVVPFSWFEVLAALESAPENRVRLGDLVDIVLLSKAGLSRLLDRLGDASLVQRETCTADGRGLDVVLTSKGATALQRARPVYSQSIELHLAQHLTASQTSAMIGLFRSVLAANDWLPDARPVAVTVSKRLDRPKA